jgi:translation initiation factor IF-2
VLCGRHWGRVRALINDHGVKVKQAGPATPVMCLGLSGVPEAGAAWRVCVNERIAKTLAEKERQENLQSRGTGAAAPRKASLDTLFDQLKADEKLELKIILKADTQGSLEAIRHALGEIHSEKVSLNIVLAGAGNITVNDVMLASASNAVILGFHVPTETGVNAAAKREGVEIRLHQIIYELLDQVRDAMAGLLAPEIREKITGRAVVLQVFTIGKAGKIAGCRVEQGFVAARSRVRVRRADGVLFDGTIITLKHFQDAVNEVREGQECGIRLAGFANFEEGDMLEFYDLSEVQQTL